MKLIEELSEAWHNQGRLGDPERKGPPYSRYHACQVIAQELTRRGYSVDADGVEAWFDGDGGVRAMEAVLKKLGHDVALDYGGKGAGTAGWVREFTRIFKALGLPHAISLAQAIFHTSVLP